MRAFTSDGSDTRIWGLSVNPEWWEGEWNSSDPYAKQYIEHLAAYSPYLRPGPSCYAALVAGAIEEVRLWEQCGIEIKNRHWADLGGSDGYYAVAWKIGGALKATLIDAEPPGEWASPVLEQAGVEVKTCYLPEPNVTDADSACILHVPGLDPIEMLEETPSLRVLVTKKIKESAVASLTSRNWTVEKITIPTSSLFFTMAEGCAAPGRSPRKDDVLYVLRGRNQFSPT
jgi:hypothetical protein